VEQVLAGPTDEDPEQRTDATEEFQAARDGTVGLLPEEMLAYWRLFYWVEHQSFEKLQQRAPGNVPFGDLMQFPDDYRGKLVSLDLNVRRVMSYDVENSPAGIPRVYEVWAWSDDSQAWLYSLVTAHLPEGMQVGQEVYERAKFVGYFLKLHGYYEAGAKPRAAPLRAPLLVGRFQRIPQGSGRKPSSAYEWLAVAAVAGMLVMLAAATMAQRRFARRTAQQQADRQGSASEATHAWLRGDCPNSGFSLDTMAEADRERPNPFGGEQIRTRPSNER
jgi:heme exporter protein D